MICEGCGVEFHRIKRGKRDARRFHSRACSDANTHVWHPKPWRPFRIKYLRRCHCGQWFWAAYRLGGACSIKCRSTTYYTKMAPVYASRKPLVKRTCRECRVEFVPEFRDKRRWFHSSACSRKWGKRIQGHVDRARRRKAIRERFDPREIFIRDRWRCGLCGRGVSKRLRCPHPKSATLDHIVPLSLGGTHERRNVQLAHRDCNSAKRELACGSQMLVFG